MLRISYTEPISGDCFYWTFRKNNSELIEKTRKTKNSFRFSLVVVKAESKVTSALNRPCLNSPLTQSAEGFEVCAKWGEDKRLKYGR